MKNDALSLLVALIFLALFAGVIHVPVSAQFRSQHCINIVACLSTDRPGSTDARVVDGRSRYRERHDMAMSRAGRSLSFAATGKTSSDSRHVVRDYAAMPVMRLILRRHWEPPAPNASPRRPSVLQPMS